MYPIVFKEGDKVRFIGGIYVISYPDKCVEYDMKDRTGIIKSRFSFSKYRVEVEIDGVKRQVIASETDIRLQQRIATLFSDAIEYYQKILEKDIDRLILSRPFIMPDFMSCRIANPVDKIVSDKSESKMTKDRCIKLLESYRAERDKVQKGRKFERCLRFDVVNEALEKAIELLKGGAA